MPDLEIPKRFVLDPVACVIALDFEQEKPPMIDLYFWPTGNGKKIVILLEELGLPYTIKPINIGRGDQLTPDFLKISPNGRMPAIVDDEPIGGGAPMSIFESGAIMTYLAEKTGRFMPSEPRGRYDVAQWVSWQMANQGPKLGEQGHFRRALDAGNNGDLSYAIRRFDNEAHRIYGVMNLGLFNKHYLAADQYTIADMICYPWASSWATRKIDIDEFPNVKRWLEEIGERPAVKKAMAMGPEFREDPASISPEEQAPPQKTGGGPAGAAGSRRMAASRLINSAVRCCSVRVVLTLFAAVRDRRGVFLARLVGVRGFEPPAPASRKQCSTRLSYTPPTGCGSIAPTPRHAQGSDPGRASLTGNRVRSKAAVAGEGGGGDQGAALGAVAKRRQRVDRGGGIAAGARQGLGERAAALDQLDRAFEVARLLIHRLRACGARMRAPRRRRGQRRAGSAG